MRRSMVRLVLGALLVGASPVTAQQPTIVLCVTVAGVPPAGEWGAGSLAAAIADGSATVEQVAPPGTCVPPVSGGPVGWYSTGPGSTYGFDFPGDGTVLSRGGGDIARGTYTVDGDLVLVCAGPFCNELELIGRCLFDTDDIGMYCTEAYWAAKSASPTP